MNTKTVSKVRRQYDPEFKADTVRLVTEGGHRPIDVCREVGITTKMLGQWRRQLGVTTGNGHYCPLRHCNRVSDTNTGHVLTLRGSILAIDPF